MNPQQQFLANYQSPAVKMPGGMGTIDISKTGVNAGDELQRKRAKQMGWDDARIDKAMQYQAFMKALQAKQAPMGGYQVPDAKKKKGNWATELIPIPFSIAGAALGSMVAPGAGTIAGGAGGAMVGQAVENMFEGNDVLSDPKEYALEAGFGAIPGVFKSAKILKNAPKGFKSLKMLVQSPVSSNLAQNATRLAKSGQSSKIIAANQVAKGGKDVANLLPKTSGNQYIDDALRAGTKQQSSRVAEAGYGQTYKGNVLERAGFGLRNNLINPKAIASPSGAHQSAQLTNDLIKYGVHGSPKKMLAQFGNLSDDLGAQVDTALAKSKAVVPGGINGVSKGIADYASQAMDFTPTRARNINEVFRNFVAPKIKTGSMAEVRNAHKALNGQLTSAFDKLAKGAQLTEKEQALMATRNYLDDVLKQYAPEAKSLLREYSNLFEASKGLARQADKSFSVPIVGLNSQGLRQGLFKAQDAVGRGLMNTGSALSFQGGNPAKFAKAMSPGISFAQGVPRGVGDIAKMTAAYGGANLAAKGLTGNLNVAEPTTQLDANGFDPNDPFGVGVTEEELMTAAEQAGVDPVTALSMLGVNVDQLAAQAGGFAQDGVTQDNQITNEMVASGQLPADQLENQPQQSQQPISRESMMQAIMNDMQYNEGKNVNNLIKFYEFANADYKAAEPTKLTAAQSKQLTNIGVVEAQLAQLDAYVNSGMFPDSNQLSASLGGIFNKTIGQQIDPKQRVYIQQLRSRGIQVIRALGEVGNLTATEQEAAIQTLPAPGDNLETARMKMEILKDLFARVRQSTLTQGGYTEDFSGTNVVESPTIDELSADVGGFGGY